MLVIPLQISPEAFFGVSNVFVLPASRDGIQRLSEFLWDYLAIEEKGTPLRIGTGPYPQSVFYASTGTYNLGHTCNTWTAEALRTVGLPVTTTARGFRESGSRPASNNCGEGTRAHLRHTLTPAPGQRLWRWPPKTGK